MSECRKSWDKAGVAAGGRGDTLDRFLVFSDSPRLSNERRKGSTSGGVGRTQA